mmetsp:Transcript_55819/g.163938  ORF Transcript_55819/g.163938 Transcript_55819/m.163938 type:complete len:316 (-) Transcript_55819:278-1225(-)
MTGGMGGDGVMARPRSLGVMPMAPGTKACASARMPRDGGGVASISEMGVALLGVLLGEKSAVLSARFSSILSWFSLLSPLVGLRGGGAGVVERGPLTAMAGSIGAAVGCTGCSGITGGCCMAMDMAVAAKACCACCCWTAATIAPIWAIHVPIQAGPGWPTWAIAAGGAAFQGFGITCGAGWGPRGPGITGALGRVPSKSSGVAPVPATGGDSVSTGILMTSPTGLGTGGASVGGALGGASPPAGSTSGRSRGPPTLGLPGLVGPAVEAGGEPGQVIEPAPIGLVGPTDMDGDIGWPAAAAAAAAWAAQHHAGGG